MEAVRLIISERPSSPSVMSTTGPEIELEEIPKIATLQERKERPSSPSVMSTTGPERELEEIPKIVKLQERKESLWNNKVMVSRSKISKEGGIQMVQNVPSRLIIPSKALRTPTEVTCSIWHPHILSPPLGRNEALVSSVIELACGSLSSTKKSYKFNEKVKLALSHSASDIKGYELVIKELINEKTNDWRDLETKWAWKPSGGGFFVIYIMMFSYSHSFFVLPLS
ncbi:uncharacterized protein LOC111347179 isoform X3 [Stylophora pistillata]|uniref:uncharacterized protein LOC111347179 isoform X3 n=1 Tax=Stylophora pistillata TaxID=50429 RepID=UPI000C051D2D|nr:uncharacterized protein LOC111347179 isoform X3 [Stylophora pistillata]